MVLLLTETKTDIFFIFVLRKEKNSLHLSSRKSNQHSSVDFGELDKYKCGIIGTCAMSLNHSQCAE